MSRESLKKPEGRVAVAGGRLYSERRAYGKSIFCLAVLMLSGPGQKKKTEGLQYQKPKRHVLLWAPGNFSHCPDKAATGIYLHVSPPDVRSTPYDRHDLAFPLQRLPAVLDVQSSTPARAKPRASS
ncbi:MAG: hypothetical protein OXB98_08095 [Bryobacterales bacterium]|nr:hypothetical protein [Bryobacterales bacterium]